MIDKIRQPKKEIELEKQNSNCKHTFGEPYYNPTTEMVQDGRGSNQHWTYAHWSYAGYKETEKPRWSRKCSSCGFKQHTFKQTPIIIGTEH